MSLWAYVGWRLVQSAVLVLVVVSLCFAIIQMAPGDPVLYLYGAQSVSAETLDEIRRQWGLDRPAWEQYLAYVRNVARGDLGYSMLNREPVSSMLRRIAPNTLLLMVPSILLASLVGVLLGVSSARRVNSVWDYAIGSLSMIGYSTPPFWLGILLIIVFASTLRWLPTQGMTTLGTSARGLAHALDVACTCCCRSACSPGGTWPRSPGSRGPRCSRSHASRTSRPRA